MSGTSSYLIPSKIAPMSTVPYKNMIIRHIIIRKRSVMSTR